MKNVTVINKESSSKKGSSKTRSSKKISSNVNYIIPMVDKCNLGKEFYYRSERGKLSLPCPSCSFGGFSKLFDGYDKVTKLSLLTHGKKGSKAVKQVSFSWQDWKYPKGNKYKVLKQSMKRCIAKHFARFMHLEQNLKLVKEKNLKHVELGNRHEIYNLPSKWQVNMNKDIKLKIDCMTITIDH